MRQKLQVTWPSGYGASFRFSDILLKLLVRKSEGSNPSVIIFYFILILDIWVQRGLVGVVGDHGIEDVE